MRNTTYLAAYAGSFVLLAALDALWLGLVAKPLYQQGIGHLMTDTPNLAAAALFYLMYPVGLVIFAVAPQAGRSVWAATLARGALFGFFAYATYDLTNLATLRGWPVILSVLDVAWGAGVSAAAAAGGKAMQDAVSRRV